MLDLKRLQAKFDALFEQENEDTFADWLKEKQMREVISSLGDGHLFSIKSGEFKMISDEKLFKTPIHIEFNNEYLTFPQVCQAA